MIPTISTWVLGILIEIAVTIPSCTSWCMIHIIRSVLWYLTAGYRSPFFYGSLLVPNAGFARVLNKRIKGGCNFYLPAY